MTQSLSVLVEKVTSQRWWRRSAVWSRDSLEPVVPSQPRPLRSHTSAHHVYRTQVSLPSLLVGRAPCREANDWGLFPLSLALGLTPGLPVLLTLPLDGRLLSSHRRQDRWLDRCGLVVSLSSHEEMTDLVTRTVPDISLTVISARLCHSERERAAEGRFAHERSVACAPLRPLARAHRVAPGRSRRSRLSSTGSSVKRWTSRSTSSSSIARWRP